MKIGFIGAGKMAQAMARGLIKSGRYPPENLSASCPKIDLPLLHECKKLGLYASPTMDDVSSVRVKRPRFAPTVSASAARSAARSATLDTQHSTRRVARENNVIFVAVKPDHVPKVISEIAPLFRRDHLLISIALGITIRFIEQLLPSKSRVVRVMPNTPAVVGAGASAYSMGSACQDGDSQVVQDLFSTVGYAVEVPEIHIDPVTGLSGSGPSYALSVIEGLADGGVKLGLSRELSMKLAAMSLLGAARMYLETGEHPAILKEAIQSPGGSTIFGIHELEKGGMRALLINAVEAASERSRRTGQELMPAGRASVIYRSEI